MEDINSWARCVVAYPQTRLKAWPADLPLDMLPTTPHGHGLRLFTIPQSHSLGLSRASQEPASLAENLFTKLSIQVITVSIEN